MLNFRLFIESDERQSFLQSHLENPYDDSHLLIFADWLEEHDDPKLANLIRLVLKGHNKQGGRKWHNEVSELLNELKDKLSGKVHIVNDHTFDLLRVRGYNYLRHRINFNQIEVYRPVKGVWEALSPKKWTPIIVEAALYIILSKLALQPDKRYKEDDETWHDRPAGLGQRQLYQSLISYINWLNYANTNFGDGDWISHVIEQPANILIRTFNDYKGKKPFPHLLDRVVSLSNELIRHYAEIGSRHPTIISQVLSMVTK